VPSLARAPLAAERPATRGVVLMPFDLTLADWLERGPRVRSHSTRRRAIEPRAARRRPPLRFENPRF
jgi:hypothetical protein